MILPALNKITKTLLPILAVLVLAVSVFSFVLYKDSPSGTDAYTYIHDAMWIQDNDKVTTPYQDTYAGAKAYVAPVTAMNLFILSDASRQDITFPVTTFYQIAIIIALVGSLLAVALTTGSRRLAILTIIFLLGNYGLFRLNIGTTISNEVAFILINSIALTIWWMRKRVEVWHVIALVIQIIGLILLHKYLTAPLFIFTLLGYGLAVLIFSKSTRDRCKNFLNLHAWLKIGAPFGFFLVVGVLYFVFQNPIIEGINSFVFVTATSDPSAQSFVFHWHEYKHNIGSFLMYFGVAGFIMFPFAFRHYWSQFGLLWVFTGFALATPLGYFVFGIPFYYDRIIIMIIPYLALFAAVLFDTVLTWMSPVVQRLTLASMITTAIVFGVGTNIDIYNSSNFVTAEHTEAYRFLNRISETDELILTNNNNISANRHDAIISHRNIHSFSIHPKRADEPNGYSLENELNGLIRKPNSEELHLFMNDNNARYVVLVKQGAADEKYLEDMILRYRNSPDFQRLYKNNAIEIFEIIP